MKTTVVTPRNHYLLRLERGEEVIASITDFCAKHFIHAATFTAIGAIERSTIGYYNLALKQYGKRTYDDAMEVASMTGNVALVDGTPFVHAHAVLSGIVPGTENTPLGGHVFEAYVAVTLEIHLQAYVEGVTREHDEFIGLKLLCLES